MTYFETSNYNYKITVVEVEKETAKCIWIRGYRHAKRSDYQNFFKTREEAKEYLLKRAHRKIESAKRDLQWAEENLAEAEAL